VVGGGGPPRRTRDAPEHGMKKLATRPKGAKGASKRVSIARAEGRVEREISSVISFNNGGRRLCGDTYSE